MAEVGENILSLILAIISYLDRLPSSISSFYADLCDLNIDGEVASGLATFEFVKEWCFYGDKKVRESFLSLLESNPLDISVPFL